MPEKRRLSDPPGAVDDDHPVGCDRACESRELRVRDVLAHHQLNELTSISVGCQSLYSP